MYVKYLHCVLFYISISVQFCKFRALSRASLQLTSLEFIMNWDYDAVRNV